MIASFALRPGAPALRLPELVGALCRRLRAPELRDLEKIMLSWAAWRARQTGLNIEAEDLTEVNRMENYDDVQAMRIQAEMRELSETMLTWACWQAKKSGLKIEPEEIAEVSRMENSDDVEAFFATRVQMRKEECHAEGRVMGQRESMRRQAAMKFDAATAARLGAVLEGVTDQEVFDGVLAALIECDTPSDLLERVAEVRRRTNGRNLPADC